MDEKTSTIEALRAHIREWERVDKRATRAARDALGDNSISCPQEGISALAWRNAELESKLAESRHAKAGEWRAKLEDLRRHHENMRIPELEDAFEATGGDLADEALGLKAHVAELESKLAAAQPTTPAGELWAGDLQPGDIHEIVTPYEWEKGDVKLVKAPDCWDHVDVQAITIRRFGHASWSANREYRPDPDNDIALYRRRPDGLYRFAWCSSPRRDSAETRKGKKR